MSTSAHRQRGHNVVRADAFFAEHTKLAAIGSSQAFYQPKTKAGAASAISIRLNAVGSGIKYGGHAVRSGSSTSAAGCSAGLGGSDNLSGNFEQLQRLFGHRLPEQRLDTGDVDAQRMQGRTQAREKRLTSTILTDQEWHQFRGWFEQVYPGFAYRLKETFPRLSPAEARFFYLMKLDLSSREIAAMLGISIEAIHKLRYRLRKKLQLEEDGGFETVISKIS